VILDPALLTKLERLSLVARRVRPGQVAGERRSTRRGTSVEFADYRDYTRGDDLRHVDWNIYARLERPFVKLFEEEEDLAVHLLLDASQSMSWRLDLAGEQLQGTDKWLYARQLVAALGAIALKSGDWLTVATMFSSARPPERFGPLRGRGHTLRLLEWLEQRQTAGTTDLNAQLRNYALSGGRAGLVLLVSDLFSPAGYIAGMTALGARGHELAILHLLSPDEMEPPLAGDLRLIDVETRETQEVTIDGAARDRYRRRIVAWQEEIRTACQARMAHYLPVCSNAPLEYVLLTALRRARVVR